ncbi:hypothetical protein ABPG77_004187 [Micractinium sp. CCAP 211/92]
MGKQKVTAQKSLGIPKKQLAGKASSTGDRTPAVSASRLLAAASLLQPPPPQAEAEPSNGSALEQGSDGCKLPQYGSDPKPGGGKQPAQQDESDLGAAGDSGAPLQDDSDLQPGGCGSTALQDDSDLAARPGPACAAQTRAQAAATAAAAHPAFGATRGSPSVQQGGVRRQESVSAQGEGSEGTDTSPSSKPAPQLSGQQALAQQWQQQPTEGAKALPPTRGAGSCSQQPLHGRQQQPQQQSYLELARNEPRAAEATTAAAQSTAAPMFGGMAGGAAREAQQQQEMQRLPAGHAPPPPPPPPPQLAWPAPPDMDMRPHLGSGGLWQVPAQPYTGSSWAGQQPRDPRLLARVHQASPPVAHVHGQPSNHQHRPAQQPMPQVPAQHGRHAGLPPQHAAAGAAAPPHPAWGLPAAVDDHNVNRVFVGRDQLVDAVHLERALQDAGMGLSLLQGLLLRCKRGTYQLREIRGLDADGRLSLQLDTVRLLPTQASGQAPHPDEISGLAQRWRACGQPLWTAGHVARLCWQRRLMEEWPKKLGRNPATGALLPMRPDGLHHLAAELQNLTMAVGFLERGRDSDEEEEPAPAPAAALQPSAAPHPAVLQDSDDDAAHPAAAVPLPLAPGAAGPEGPAPAGRASPPPPLPAEPPLAVPTDAPTAKAGPAGAPKVAVIPKKKSIVIIPPRPRAGMEDKEWAGTFSREATPQDGDGAPPSPAGVVSPPARPGAPGTALQGPDAAAVAAAAVAAHAQAKAAAAAAPTSAAAAVPYVKPHAHNGYKLGGCGHMAPHTGYLAGQAYNPYQAVYAYAHPTWQRAQQEPASAYPAWQAGLQPGQAHASPVAPALDPAQAEQQQAGQEPTAGGGAAGGTAAPPTAASPTPPPPSSASLADHTGPRELQEMLEELRRRKSGERPGRDDPEADPAQWDPGWGLEARLVGILSERGKQPFFMLLQRLDSTPIPAFLDAEPGRLREATLKQLIENRPQLFDVILGDTIQLKKGAQGFLRLKQRILQALYCSPNKRTLAREVHAVAVEFLDDNVLDLSAAVHNMARRQFAAFVRDHLWDSVWRRRCHTKGALVLELRPFEAERPCIVPCAAAFPPQCPVYSSCALDVACPKSHAPPRSEAADPFDVGAMHRLRQERVAAGTGVYTPASKGVSPPQEPPPAGTTNADEAAEQQQQHHVAAAAGSAPHEVAAAVTAPLATEALQHHQPPPVAVQAPGGEPSGSCTVDAAEANGGGEDTAATRSFPEQVLQLPRKVDCKEEQAQPGSLLAGGSPTAVPAALQSQQERQELQPSSRQPGSREATPDICDLPEALWQVHNVDGLAGASGEFALLPLQPPPPPAPAGPAPDVQRGMQGVPSGSAAAPGAEAAVPRGSKRRSRNRSSSVSAGRGRGKQQRSSGSGRRTRSGSMSRSRGKERKERRQSRHSRSPGRRRARDRSPSPSRSRRRARIRSRSRSPSRHRAGSRSHSPSRRRARSRSPSHSRHPSRRISRSAGLDMADDFWDPTWRLELACVQSLMRQGDANPSAVYRAVVQQGGLELPSCLREGQDSEEAAFRRFINGRSHLFNVGLARGSALPRVCLVPGAPAFLRYKRDFLDHLWSCPSRRCHASDLEARVPVEAELHWREQAARADDFALAYLRDAVFVRMGWLELRPFRSREVGFPAQCKFAIDSPAGCRHGTSCRFCHAPPRGMGPFRELTSARFEGRW